MKKNETKEHGIDKAKKLSKSEQKLQKEINVLQESLDKAQTESDNYLDQLKRLQAEFDNYRKRTQKQISDTLEQGQKKLSSELLVILENLDKALEFKEIDFNGLELIDRELNNILTSKGLKKMEALNEEFDHNIHHAVGFSEVESDSGYSEGTIIEVLQPGFYWKDEVLRPAMVVVAKEKVILDPEESLESEIKTEEDPQLEDINQEN